MTIWLTSDEHYDHANIIRFSSRPFNSVNHMQVELVARHNSVVQPDDEVWHIGDFSMSEKTVPLILPQLNGKHTLVMGNHDKCHTCHKNHEVAKQRYLQYGFVGVHQEVHNFHGFILNHLPRAEEGEHGKKFAQWRPQKQVWEAREEVFQLHGHTHLPPEKRMRHHMLDVGIDGNNYYPISLDEIKALVKRERLREKTGTK
jgi:calcineurin-like phosphoesterase family protein